MDAALSAETLLSIAGVRQAYPKEASADVTVLDLNVKALRVIDEAAERPDGVDPFLMLVAGVRALARRGSLPCA